MEHWLRTEGVPALSFWNQVFDVFRPIHKQVSDNLIARRSHQIFDSETGQFIHFTSSGLGGPVADEKFQDRIHLTICEDNEATIKIVLKKKSNVMRHVGRTHRVNLEWVFHLISTSSSVHLRYIRTTSQLADMYTKHFPNPDRENG